MQIAILTCLWKRHDLERLSLRWNRDALARAGFTVTPLAVGSEGKASKAVAESAGYNYLEAPNEPLSDKHNAGMAWLEDRKVTWDAVMILGSDNFVSTSYGRHVKTRLERGDQAIRARGIYFYEPGGELFYARGCRTGAGTTISRALAGGVRYRFWDDGLDKGLDASIYRRVLQKAAPCDIVYDLPRRGVAILDVKTDVNVTTWTDVKERFRIAPVPAPAFFGQHFRKLKPALDEL